MLSKLALIASGISVSCIALSTPTSLVMRPVADLMGHRAFSKNITAIGGEHHIQARPIWSNGGTLGLFDRVELGYDNDFAGGWIHDCKVKLLESNGDKRFLVSGGFANVSTTNNTIDKYIATRYDATSIRFHASYYFDSVNRGVFGIDFGLPNGWSGAIERTSGPGAITWLAVNLPVKFENLQLMVAAGIPNQRSDGYQYSICLTYGLRL